MTYQELLISPEWKAKRKEIVTRDDLKCSSCDNSNLVKDPLIGLLKYKSHNDNGTTFNFYCYNSSDELVRKRVFIKKGTTIRSFGSLRPPGLWPADP